MPPDADEGCACGNLDVAASPVVPVVDRTDRAWNVRLYVAVQTRIPDVVEEKHRSSHRTRFFAASISLGRSDRIDDRQFRDLGTADPGHSHLQSSDRRL